MDCSLSTWPSINQYDEFLWSGLGDLDQFENFDRVEANASVSQNSSIRAEAVCNTVNQDMDFQQGSDFYESSPPVDLDSVLGSSVPQSGVPSAPVDEDDDFDICFGHMLIQSQKQIDERTNIFLADPITNSAEVNAVNHSDPSAETCEFMCFADNPVQVDDELRSATPSMMDPLVPTPNQTCDGPSLPRTDIELQKEDVSQSEASMASIRSQNGCRALNSPARFLVNGILDPREGLQTSTLPSVRIGPGMPWPGREMGSAIVDSAKYVNRASVQAEHGGLSSHDQRIQSPQILVVPSEIEMEKAQDSRARRLAASKRRARKYPLQKLIRMSSSTASSTRAKLMNSSGIPLQMVCSAPSATLSVTPQTSAQLMNVHNPQYLHGNHGDDRSCEEGGALSTRDKLALPHIVQEMKPLQNSAELLDASELEQLQNVLQKMNTELRLQIRDAFYRLAKSAKSRQNASMPDASSSDSSIYEMEPQTNPVDRWIANLLFSKA